MKKTLSMLLALVLCLSLLTTAVLAADPALVFVSISSEGQLVSAMEPVLAEDADEDGTVSISDALYAAHELLYQGGAAAGYAAGMTEYGLSLEKLWGVENGGSYGYYVNDASAWSLADPVADGDMVYAFSYQDLIGWSDAYSYFDTYMVITETGAEVPMTLYVSGWDEEWNPVSLPCAGAAIYGCQADTYAIALDTEPLAVTDENGQFTLCFEEAGDYFITAVSEDLTITPPVCEIFVMEAEELGELDLSEWLFEGFEGDDEPLTRQLLVDVLYYMEEAPDVAGENPYTDVSDDNLAVLWATQNGLVNGYGDGTFGGENALTREQAAVILCRYMAYSGVGAADLIDLFQMLTGEQPPMDLGLYPDGDAVDAWAAEAMQTLAFLFADPGETLRPTEALTYGDVAAMAERLLSLIPLDPMSLVGMF